MGTLPPTPNLGLILPDPGTTQPFSTAVQNGWFTSIDTAVGADRARLAVIEDLTKPAAPNANVGVIPAGTAAERDAFWGIPATAADRVALANKAPRWVNTDTNFGFEQRYFAPTTDSAQGGYLAQNARGAGGWMAAVPFEKARFFRDTAAATVPTSLTDIPGFSLAVPCSGGKLRIRAELHWVNPASGADRVVGLKAFNDGVEITPVVTQTLIPFFTGASVGIMSNYVWEITPTAGTHTFKLQYSAPVASSVSLVSPSLMTVEEIPG